MHRALEVSDILYLVFKCDLSESDLFRCALVCRLWGLWASDFLWRAYHVPLQYVINGLAESSRRLEANGFPRFYIIRIDESAWRRFLALSNKTTRITIDCGLDNASLQQIRIAKQMFDGEPFGRLRTLKMTVADGQQESLSLLTVPSLTRVSLLCQYLCDDYVPDVIFAKAPDITHLAIGDSWKISLNVSKYSALECLEICCGLTAHLWESLSSCRFLTKVVLTHCTDIRETWRVDYIYFPALRTFKVRRRRSRVALQLTLRSRMPMLECMSLDSRSRPRDQELWKLMMAHLALHSRKLDIARTFTSSNLEDCEDSDDDCW